MLICIPPLWQVPAVPRTILEKGKWYVDHQSTHIWMERDGKGSFIWYFLVKDNKAKLKKIGKMSLAAYKDCLKGKMPSGVKSYEQLVNTCFSMHYVVYSKRTVPACEFNVEELCCPTCKGFKQYGICSQVCAINPFPTLVAVRRPVYCEGRGSKFFANDTRFFCAGRLEGCLGPTHTKGFSVSTYRRPVAAILPQAVWRQDGTTVEMGSPEWHRPLRTSNRRSCVVR